MKQIKAIIKPIRLEAVLEALHEHLELPGISVSHVQGFGQKVGREASEDGSLLPFGTRDMAKIECVADDEILDSIMHVIQSTAHTGEDGDGKIFIVPVEEASSIRHLKRATLRGACHGDRRRACGLARRVGPRGGRRRDSLACPAGRLTGALPSSRQRQAAIRPPG